MAKAMNLDSKRLYSWWWDSHISPKNSKWLQENLRDMDSKVSLMIRLLEEDGDSFAKKAEMYYKKRPELMKLVEDFYRAYRALAERYEHATRALRQAHRTIQEAFPNEISSSPSDDFSSKSSEPQTPEMGSEARPLFEADDPPEETSDVERPSFLSIKRNQGGSTGRRVLKTVNELFPPGKARKGLNFFEEEGKVRKGTEFSPLRQTREEEMRRLEELVSKSESERESALLECKKLAERIAEQEQENERINRELGDKLSSLESSRERCLHFETETAALKEELVSLAQEMNDKLKSKAEEMDKFKGQNEDLRKQLRSTQEELTRVDSSAKEEHLMKVNAEKKTQVLLYDLQAKAETIRDAERRSSHLEEEVERLKQENGKLNGQILSSESMIKSLSDEISVLEEKVKELENEEVNLHRNIGNLQDEVAGSSLKLKSVIDQIEAVGFSEESFRVSVSEMLGKNRELRESCRRYEGEKKSLVGHLEEVKEKSSLQEKSLLETSEKLETFKEKTRCLEESCKSLMERNDILVDQLEKLTVNNSIMGGSLTDAERVIGELKEKIQELTENKNALESSLKQAEGVIGEMKEKNSTLESYLTEAKEVIKKVAENNSMLESSLKDAEGFIVELKGKVQELTENNSTLESSLKDAEGFIVELKGKTQELTENNSTLESSLKDVEGFIVELKEKIQKLTENNSILDSSLKDAEGFIFELKEKVQKLTENNSTLDSSLKDAEGFIFEMKEKVQKLTENNSILDSSLKDAEGFIFELKEKVQKLTENNSILDSSLKDAEGFIVELKEKLQKLTENNSILESSMKDAEGFILELKDKVQRLTEDNSTLDSSLKNSEIFIVELKEKVQILTENNSTLDSSLKDAQGFIVELKEKVQILTEMNSTLDSALKDAQGFIVELQEKVQKLTENNSTLDSSLKDAQRFIVELREKVRMVTENNSSLESSLKDAECFIVDLKENIQTLTENNSTLESSLKDAQGFIAELKEKVQTITENNATLDSSLKDAQGLIAELNEKVHRLTDKNSSLKSSLKDAEGFIVELKENVQRLIDDNSSLESSLKEATETIRESAEKIQKLTVSHYMMENSLKEATETIGDSTEKIKKLAESNSLLESSLTEAKQTIGESTAKIKKLTESNSLLESSLTEAKQTIDESTAKIQKLTESNSLLESSLKKATETIGDSTEKLQKLTMSNSGLESSLTEAKKMIGGLMEKIQGFVQSHEDEKVVLLDNIGKEVEKSVLLEKSLSLTGAELDAEREKNKYLEQSCASLSARIQDLMLENNSLNQRLSASAQSLENVSKNSTLLEKLLKKANEDIEGMRVVLFSLTRELDGLRVSFKDKEATLLADLEGLKLKVISLEESCDSLHRRMSELIAENRNLADQLEQITKNNALLENTLTCAYGMTEQLRETIQSLIQAHKEEKDLLLGESKKHTENNLVLEKSLSEVRSKLEESCESLNKKIQELTVENEGLRQQLSFVNQSLEDVSNSSLQLETSLSNANEENKLLREQLLSLNLELERLQDGFKEKEAFLTVQQDETAEKSRLLEKSLFETAAELEGLILKERSLEESCDSLNMKVAETLRQLEASSQKNVILNDSLTDAHWEIEGLREKMKMMDASVITLADENSNLLSEKISLSSQLESTLESIETLSRRHMDLEEKCQDLEREKKSTLVAVGELKSSLYLSQQDSQRKDEELEGIEEEILETQVRCFILEMHLLHAGECFQKLSNAFSGMNRKNLDQEKVISSISEHNKNLQDGINAVLEVLGIKSASNDDIIIEISVVKKLLSETIDDNSFLILKDSINTTLLRHLGFDLMNLKSENKVKGEQLLALGRDKVELHQSNTELSQVVHSVQCREAQLMVIISELRDQIENLEGENRSALMEVMSMSFLSLLYEQLALEREIMLTDLQEKMEEFTQNYILLESQKGVLEVSAYGLSQQLEFGKTLLGKKDLELVEALQRLKTSEEADQKLRADVDGIRGELSDSACLIDELESKIGGLMDEVALYEEEISKLCYEAQVSAAYAQIFEDKMFELTEKYDELEEKLTLSQEGSDSLNRECGALKETLTAYLPLVFTLQESMRELENEIFSSSRQSLLEGDLVQEESTACPPLKKTNPPSDNIPSATDPNGIVGLQKLQHQIEALRKLIRSSDFSMQSELGNKNGEKIVIIRDLVEGIRREGSESTTQHHAHMAENYDISDQMLRLWETAETDTSKTVTGKEERGNSSFGLMRENEGVVDRMGQLGKVNSRHDWSQRMSDRLSGDAHRLLVLHDSIQELKAQMDKLASLGKKSTERKTQMERFRVLGRKSAEPKSLIEKFMVLGKQSTEQDTQTEVSENLGRKSTGSETQVDDFEVSSKKSTESFGVLEKKEMRNPMEKIGASGKWSTEQNYQTMAMRLRRIDEEVSAMVDVNADSAQQAESLIGEERRVNADQKKQVFELVQRGSERIGKLELELQKIRYIVYKIVEEREARGKGGRRPPRTMLRDYLYGRREGSGERRGWLYGCCILPDAGKK
ncbi:uncharacterized protein LOC144702763 [Wolffia australiana]